MSSNWIDSKSLGISCLFVPNGNDKSVSISIILSILSGSYYSEERDENVKKLIWGQKNSRQLSGKSIFEILSKVV